MKKMQKFATLLLLLAFAGCIIAWPFRANFWGGLLLTAFEAAIVGALADWFAVVAIFRHPMGLKFIPHTAVIPNNRERIIGTIIDIVENQWLNIEALKTRIDELPIVEKLENALKTQEGKERLEGIATSFILNTIKDMDSEYIAGFLQKVVQDNFTEVSFSEDLLEKLEISLKELYMDDVIDFFLDKSVELAKDDDFVRIVKNTMHRAAEEYSSKGNILRKLGLGLGEGFNLINYQEAAESVSGKLADFLSEMKAQRNPYRVKVKIAVGDFRLSNQETASEAFNGLIKKMISTEDGFSTTVEVVKTLKQHLITDDLGNAPIVKYLSDMIIEQIEGINRDEFKKKNFEGWIKKEAIELVEKYHGIIGSIVKDNLDSLNDESFSTSLEEKVGEDLQWIRVNGTVIGALVGVVQYLVLHLI